MEDALGRRRAPLAADLGLSGWATSVRCTLPGWRPADPWPYVRAMERKGWDRNPAGQVLIAVLLVAASTFILLAGDMDRSTRRYGIPYTFLVPFGYVMAVVIALNAARIWRRRNRP